VTVWSDSLLNVGSVLVLFRSGLNYIRYPMYSVSDELYASKNDKNQWFEKFNVDVFIIRNDQCCGSETLNLGSGSAFPVITDPDSAPTFQIISNPDPTFHDISDSGPFRI